MKIKFPFSLILLFAIQLTANGQTTSRVDAFKVREQLKENSLTANLPATNIGPTICSGRVADLEVNPEDPTEFFVAYASGGLWHTKNNGTTFEPLFQKENVMTIGDIAVNWEYEMVWVGTGEVNSSRSSYAGTGIYLSMDMGKTWQHRGLPETHHIGRIIIDKEDPSLVWVAALGHLYTSNPERGVFKTTDGGESWEKTLFVNDETGVVDLLRDPENSGVFYAAAWQRDRKAWNFTESGIGSGIFKSVDGGDTWLELTDGESAFPKGEGTGRIGLDMAYDEDGNSVLYAILDNYNRRATDKTSGNQKLKKEAFETMTAAAFASLTDEKLKSYLQENGFPEKYSVAKVKAMVAEGEIEPVALKTYVENANSLLFDTPVIGAEVYKSTDNGTTWTKTHKGYLDRLYNSYGYYFGQVRVNPQDVNQLYIMGVPILRSDDGGKQWKNVNGDNVHADHHALWINPANSNHLVNGNDGGINISYDAGENWIKCNSPQVGQFYYINADNAENYHVYGGLQDNGVWKGNHNYRSGTSWHQYGKYPYEMIMGGDGMQIQIDNRDNATTYTGYQFGNYFRLGADGDRKYITPKHELGDSPYRWNWQSPILLSRPSGSPTICQSNHLLKVRPSTSPTLCQSDHLQVRPSASPTICQSDHLVVRLSPIHPFMGLISLLRLSIFTSNSNIDLRSKKTK